MTFIQRIFHRPDPEPQHECQWEPVSAQPQHMTIWNVVKGYESGETTLILLRCAICGAVTTKRISGTWTIDEVQGKYKEDAA